MEHEEPNVENAGPEEPLMHNIELKQAVLERRRDRQRRRKYPLVSVLVLLFCINMAQLFALIQYRKAAMKKDPWQQTYCKYSKSPM